MSLRRDRRELDLGRALAAVSDSGLVHTQNEDAVTILCDPPFTIMVVCDGVSTSHDAALGSETAADATVQSLLQGIKTRRSPKELMGAAILAGHEAICALMPASSDDRPLTTIVAALANSDTVTIGWVGDSRAYLLSGIAKLLTRDDSWVNWAVEHGVMTEAEAMHSPNAHVIVQCLGDPDDPPVPHVVTTTLHAGEKLLLCSDGLWNYASTPSALVTLTSKLSADAPAITHCRALVKFANASGGRDNITAAMFIVPDGGSPS